MYQKAIYDRVVDTRVDDNPPILTNEHAELPFGLDKLPALRVFDEVFFWYQETIGAVATVVGPISLAFYNELAAY